MKRPINCPQCQSTITYVHSVRRAHCPTCRDRTFYYSYEEDSDLTSIAIDRLRFTIYIYLKRDERSYSGTQIDVKGKSYHQIKLSTPMPELIFKSNEELSQWMKTILIFQ